jgi:Zn-dependent peptidase ImmA (M78 family)/DNA-binding XRE family transcriptional regulator
VRPDIRLNGVFQAYTRMLIHKKGGDGKGNPEKLRTGARPKGNGVADNHSCPSAKREREELMGSVGKAIAENVLRNRMVLGLSQAKLAKKAGLSRLAYQNIEEGKSVPRVDTLQKVAVALGVGVMDLIEQAPTLSSVRFRSRKKMRTRQAILARVGKWLRDFNQLEELLDAKIGYRFRGLAEKLPSWHGRATLGLAREAAEVARQEADLRPDEPILDICGLLESRGVKVYALSVASHEFSGLAVAEEDGGPAIVVNVWERFPVERWIFSAAHELGHLILHLKSFNVDQAEYNKQEEDEASNFASHFLMPEEAFDKYLKKSSGLGLVHWTLKVKRIFGVSYKTVLFRLIERGLADDSVWARFNYHYQRIYGKKLEFKEEPNSVSRDQFGGSFLMGNDWKEPNELDPCDFMEDRLSALVRRAIEEEKISISRAAQILELDLVSMKELAASWERTDDKGSE